jgi:hypothetical protein
MTSRHQPDLPAHVGPCELGELGKQVAIRCPRGLAHILQRAGAVWEPGSRRWLIERHPIGPVIWTLQQRPIRCSDRRA